MTVASAETPASGTPATPTPEPRMSHTLLEDVVALITGSVLVSLGLFLLKTANLVTGGTAGLALLLDYGTGLPYPLLFAAINVPFFLAAIRRKGWDFTIRTVLTIALVAGLSALYPLPGFFANLELHPVVASVLGNLMVGVGVLILFRHHSSLGGFNIAAILLQERTGFRAGYTLMILDGLVVLASLFVVDPLLVLISALGAVILNGSLVLNHRPGRYLGV